ncbi:DsbA family protein [Spirillospora sp. CA-294931]|uniref:DsbA family protein n=1 Tax=Spirillospora sp. CA-294931 TaxID=3240042 RepID=UPI003D8D3987
MSQPPNAPWPQQPGQPWMPPPPAPPKRGNTGVVIAVVAGVALVALIAVGVAVVALRDGEGKSQAADVELRVGQIAGGAEARPGQDGSLAMARPGVERPLVEVYEDFACPSCGKFDEKHDPMLKELAVGGKAKVVFRPMVIFGEGTEPMHGNSLRAASALRCLGDGARWLSYQDVLYDHQPPSETTRGYETADLVSYARPLGVTGADFEKCVKEQRQADRVRAASKGYLSAGIQGTPSVRVNGRTLSTSDTQTPEAMRRAIESAG